MDAPGLRAVFLSYPPSPSLRRAGGRFSVLKMAELGRAVFLSYAREDNEAARRIADALRGFGVEVWFDQSEPLDRLGALSPSASSGPLVLLSRETVSLSNGLSNGLRGGDAWDSRFARSFEFGVLSFEFGNPQSGIRDPQ